MDMIQNGLAEGLLKTIRRDQRKKGVPVIGRQQPTKEVGTVNMPDFLDIAAEKSRELIRIYIRIPAYCRQFFIHFGNFDDLVKNSRFERVWDNTLIRLICSGIISEGARKSNRQFRGI